MSAAASTTKLRLSTLDYILSVMDSPQSPLDFSICFRFRGRIDPQGLLRGANSARLLFPISNSLLSKKHWVPQAANDNCLSVIPSHEEPAKTVFINRPMKLGAESPVQQLLIVDRSQGTSTLVTKFHHAAADGTSAALWLNHQLAVAFDLEPPARSAFPYQRLPLKSVTNPVKRNRCTYEGPSDELWTARKKRFGERAWNSIDFEAAELRKFCRIAGGFTYGDLLAACALETLRIWNYQHLGEHKEKIGLWLPVNIRKHPSQGFGNGTSRVRIYATYPANASFQDKCREVRRQISWCISNGEWAIPDTRAIQLLPPCVTAPIIRRTLRRPSLDMGTGVFSHMDGWVRHLGAFQTLQSIECIGLLHTAQALAINGATHDGRTWLTFTYDKGSFDSTHINRLAVLYLEQIDAARRTFQ